MYFQVPEGILCSKTHEYIYKENDSYVIGITDFAVEQLGDIVFVELPEVGTTFAQDDTFGALESVKAASEIYAPVSFKVLEANEELVSKPELLNQDPYKDGWLLKVEVTNPADMDTLMEYEDYKSEAN